MGVALAAGLHARLTADAATLIDEELQCVGDGHLRSLRLLLRLQHADERGRPVGLPQARGAGLVVGDLRDRMLRRAGELGRACGASTVARDVNGVGAGGWEAVVRDRAWAATGWRW